jgi:UDPglucose 6-dehydrogenase
MKLFVFGAGYVGIPYAAGLASLGHDVTVYDPDAKKIAVLNTGVSPIFEPGLDALLTTHRKNLTFLSDLPAAEDALASAEAAFSCVGTPDRADGRGPDLKYVLATSETAARVWRTAPSLAGPRAFVLKSTVPPSIVAPILGLFEGTTIRLISNPEFLQEGRALADFFNPSRIVMGCGEIDREFALQLATDLYGHRNAPIHVVRHASAWLSKYGANGLLATKVIFTNELARVAQATGADIEEIRLAMKDDGRIGSWGLSAGAGAFGPCFVKDLHALETFAGDTATKAQPFFAALKTANHAHCHAMADWIHRELLTSRSQRVAVWGTAFKAGTDDARTSGAVTILLQLGAWFAGVRNAPRFHLSDPLALLQTEEMLRRSSMAALVDYEPDHIAAARASDTLLVLTEWDAYGRVTLDEWKQIAGTCKRVIDLRRVLDRGMLARAGITYKALGVGEEG